MTNQQRRKPLSVAKQKLRNIFHRVSRDKMTVALNSTISEIRGIEYKTACNEHYLEEKEVFLIFEQYASDWSKEDVLNYFYPKIRVAV